MARKPYPWRVDYWKSSTGYYVGRKVRKFRTEAEAFDFVSRQYDDGYETEVFGPNCPQGSTWNGQSTA